MARVDTDADAREAEPGLGHVRGLDGIRALSVLAIIAFHSGLSWIPGGYYGVDAFFVLSGFLITTLLVGEWGLSGTIGLRRFWARRARRLLPALFLLVAVIGIVMATLPGVFSTPHAFANALSTLFYASNWYQIHAGVPYFSLSSQPSPWVHTWSLAIEEQFYLVWPIVLLLVLGFGTRRGGSDRSASVDHPYGRSVGGSTFSSHWCASVPWPRPPLWHTSLPTVTTPGPTTAPTPAPRRFSLAQPSRWVSPSGAGRAGDHAAHGLRQAWRSRAWPERPCCGRPPPKRRRSPSGAGSWRPAWLRVRWSSGAPSRPARSSCASSSCHRCRSWAGSPTACTSGIGRRCSPRAADGSIGAPTNSSRSGSS